MNTLLLTALLALSQSPAAGQPYEALDAGDVFVASITKVDDRYATHGSPPVVWLEVHEILRGAPKIARSPALWSPPSHGIDWGDENVPELKRWKKTPFSGPKVGEKFILGGAPIKFQGEQQESRQPAYRLFAFVRIPYSEKAKKETIATLAALDEHRRKYEAEQAAAAKDREERRAKWRAAMTDAVIDRRTRQADAVAIARIVSSDSYQVEAMLKGEPRMSSGGKYYFTLPREGYDRRITDLAYERSRVIVFLSEKRLVAAVTEINGLQLIDPYEGIVPADEASIAAVKASLAAAPAPKSKPVVVVSSLPRESAAPLIAALRSDYTVVESHQFSGHGDHAIAHVRKTLPGAKFLILLDGAAPTQVVAMRITPEGSTKVYEGTWGEKGVGEGVKELIGRISHPRAD